MGYVYLILEVSEDGSEERHKIGISKNDPSIRVKNLQTGNPSIISLLNSYESKNYKKIEKWLHRKFALKKTSANNEWFNLDDADVINFKNTCQEAEKTINFLIEHNPFFK